MKEFNDKIDHIINQPLLTEEGCLNQACMNELEKAIDNSPKTYERLKNDFEWNEKVYTSISDITSALAKWAIRQSPYSYPERLDEVVKYLYACLRPSFDENGIDHLTLCEINKLLYDILYEQGVEAFDNWNKSKKNGKNKNNNIAFSIACSQPDPDYDFIDLDALLHNVCIELRDERREFKRFNEEFEKKYGEQ